jgi:hypothetical protein
LFVSLFERYTCPVGKRKDPQKVSSLEAKKLCKKKKEELSDPPYVPPKEVHIRQEGRINQIAKIHRKKWV